MIAHIFDIDTLITVNSKVWIVSKKNPNIPLLKISKSDYNLIKNGVYKHQNNKIEFNDAIYWLPDDLHNKLKILSKNKKIAIDDFAISMQEFLNKDIVSNSDFQLHLENIIHLSNKGEDIYLLCSTNTERSYKDLINKITTELSNKNVIFKKIYYINDTFNSKPEDVMFKKCLLCLKHLIGYDIKNDKFIDYDIEKYNKVYFYDDEHNTLKMVDDINVVLNTIISKTDSGIKEVIIENIRDDKSKLVVNKITNNIYNKFITKEVLITLSHIVKKFENFTF